MISSPPLSFFYFHLQLDSSLFSQISSSFPSFSASSLAIPSLVLHYLRSQLHFHFFSNPLIEHSHRSPKSGRNMRSFILLNSASLALAGTILWDGRFNNVASVADLAAWSWENQVGPYQCYIHGSSPLDSYLHLDAANKNPADTESIRGAKITLDDTSYWNNQTMRRTEFIPQTTAAINTGLVYYHFSMGRSSINTPSDEHEHQIAFFESHFTEMKSGWQSGSPGDSDSSLRWVVAGSTE